MWHINFLCRKKDEKVNAAVKYFCVYYLFLYIFYSLLSKIIIVGLKPLKISFQANISMKIFVIKFCNPKKQLPLSLKTTSTQIIVSRNLKLPRQFKVRYRPRFFDQVGHQTAYASMGNKHFITK